ncbi:efflux RND transporter permease subunit [Novosphingobium pentaromativorans]|uniref:Efflux pump membrane transporter n=1 Tax=Novosphingobium pentaromativorans US6-1 TaxID=1088721 RepID=G6EG93_9SPHN|nr:multidrug efflux RND transporter permease subunit [Novosphingobium pentaromativorans]AIT82221.1 RND transporter [Novosphingobium pentaromativorans US6-1]EHJ59782.1 hydrophobe/amphiphile efflux-1 (HAE1) family protein [Novosphingobium pentaromativorans US6-1]
MRFSRFFIDRPIFAGVIAVIITVVGALAFIGLPVTQYPDIVPPTVTVSAQYPGASAETVADTVAAPIEQEINGVDDMLYMDSQSTGDGKVTITVTFKIGTDLDAAQVLVQNRVAVATPRLPQEVQQLGVVTRKSSPDFLMVVNLQSPNGTFDRDYLSNYALTQVKDKLARIDGVGDVRLFGARDYGMRIWIDPGKAAALDLTAGEIVSALRAQNVQVSSGALGQPPFDTGNAYQIGVELQGRLKTPEQFGDVIVRTDADGRQVRVRDVARVELGAQDYTTNTYLSGKPTVVIAVMQRPGSNALDAAQAVRAQMDELSQSFPQGLEYSVIYNPTEFIGQSIDAVYHTLLEAVVLVVLVILVFLQNWRAAIIPIVAIPVSLIGTAVMLAAVGYSLNNLSLFGMVLAIGIVVDDAIVVVENVERYIEEGMRPIEAARRSMDEVSGALVAIVLVLCAVFVPTLFISGISGAFYKQFAVTISTATAISLLISLTLSPALAAILLRERHPLPADAPRWRRLLQSAADRFNHGFERMSAAYAGLTLRLVRKPLRMMVTYGALIAATVGLFWATPTGFVPQQDQGYFMAAIFLPPGSSLSRTDEATQEVAKRILPVKGLRGAVMFAGFHGPSRTAAPDAAAIYFPFKSFEERKKLGVTYESIMEQAQAAMKGFDKAQVLLLPPPTINGIVPPGGYRMIVEDKDGRGYAELAKAAGAMIAQANQTPELKQVYTLFNLNTPRVYADIDRRKADMLGVPPERVFEALQVYLGSAFVNDFNLLGRTFRVTAQADSPYRGSTADIANLKTRSNSGAMVPIGSVATFEDKTGPYRVVRYNLQRAVEVDGSVAPGYSTGQALTTMERIADDTLPAGYGHEWTGIAFQQTTAGNTAGVVFGMAVLFVFLVLAAQYESLTLPLAIILIVPMCLFAAMLGVDIRGMDNNILTQIGLVVLIALAAKNAILVVEFAKQAEDEQGMSPVEAAVFAARTRLRPILMTSFAFILGAVPLVIAQGAGAELRQALGTAVFFGMVGVTGFGLLFTPTFYVVCRALGERLRRRPSAGPHGNDPLPAPAE